LSLCMCWFLCREMWHKYQLMAVFVGAGFAFCVLRLSVGWLEDHTALRKLSGGFLMMFWRELFTSCERLVPLTPLSSLAAVKSRMARHSGTSYPGSPRILAVKQGCVYVYSLQSFDTVGWATGRASKPLKSWGQFVSGVTVWLELFTT